MEFINHLPGVGVERNMVQTHSPPVVYVANMFSEASSHPNTATSVSPAGPRLVTSNLPVTQPGEERFVKLGRNFKIRYVDFYMIDLAFHQGRVREGGLPQRRSLARPSSGLGYHRSQSCPPDRPSPWRDQPEPWARARPSGRPGSSFEKRPISLILGRLIQEPNASCLRFPDLA